MSKLQFLPNKLGVEFKTITAMVKIYCKAHHQEGNKVELCQQCAEFIAYANEKLDRCPYGQNKPTCNKCPIHCYKEQQRQQAKIIMRYAGPRMLTKHPILAVTHLIAEQRAVPTTIAKKASNRHIRKSNQETS